MCVYINWSSSVTSQQPHADSVFPMLHLDTVHITPQQQGKDIKVALMDVLSARSSCDTLRRQPAAMNDFLNIQLKVI